MWAGLLPVEPTMPRFRLALAAVTALGWAATLGADEFAPRDGDSVVLPSDSIAAARIDGRLIENDTLLRFPERPVASPHTPAAANL